MNVGIIGLGKLGTIIALKLTQAGFSVTALTRTTNSKPAGVLLARDLMQLAESSQAIIVCVKPKDAREVLTELNKTLARENSEKIVVSVMAGITVNSLQESLPKAKIVRANPNICAKAGKSITALAFGKNVSELEKNSVKQIFSTIGEVIECEEKYFNAITAVSGSGPAYYYYFTQELAGAGEENGLPRELSEKLARLTLSGAGALANESKESMQELIDLIATLGGTTQAGLNELKKTLPQAVLATVSAAKKRSEELASEIKPT